MKEEKSEIKLTRLDLGEAWLWCLDCNAKLHSFDGHEDKAIRCPHKKECEDERNNYNRYR